MFTSFLTLRLYIGNVMTKIIPHELCDETDSKPVNVGKPPSKFAYKSIQMSDLLNISFRENERYNIHIEKEFEIYIIIIFY